MGGGGFALVGAYGYVQNLVQTGSALGTGKAQSDFRPDVTARGTISSGAKVAYRFVDFTGYHLRPAWRQPVADAGEAVFDALRIPVAPPESSGFPFSFDVNITSEEDKSWYGPLGFLLIVPVVVAYALPWRGRRVVPARMALAWALPIYALGLVLVYREGPWFGRYLLTAIVLVLPLVASVYRYRKVAAAVAVVGSLTVLFTHAYNAGKPTGLDSTRPVWELSRAEAQAVPIPGFAAVIERVDTEVPSGRKPGSRLRGTRLGLPVLRRAIVEASGAAFEARRPPGGGAARPPGGAVRALGRPGAGGASLGGHSLRIGPDVTDPPLTGTPVTEADGGARPRPSENHLGGVHIAEVSCEPRARRSACSDGRDRCGARCARLHVVR